MTLTDTLLASNIEVRFPDIAKITRTSWQQVVTSFPNLYQMKSTTDANKKPIALQLLQMRLSSYCLFYCLCSKHSTKIYLF